MGFARSGCSHGCDRRQRLFRRPPGGGCLRSGHGQVVQEMSSAGGRVVSRPTTYLEPADVPPIAMPTPLGQGPTDGPARRPAGPPVDRVRPTEHDRRYWAAIVHRPNPVDAVHKTTAGGSGRRRPTPPGTSRETGSRRRRTTHTRDGPRRPPAAKECQRRIGQPTKDRPPGKGLFPGQTGRWKFGSLAMDCHVFSQAAARTG
jgi:hypothetical protein